MKKMSLTAGRKIYFLLFSMIIVFLVLIFRDSGLYPVVFADEYSYSKFSRLLPFSASTLPGYLYLAIYRLTNLCGDGFLEGARILNALFFVLAAPFIYLTARRGCAKGVALIVAVLALLGSFNIYTAYFMPESLYFLSFWVFTWFVLRLDSQSGTKEWGLGGIVLGLSALVKPHALFLLPAIVAYIFYVSKRKEGKWAFQAFRNVVTFLAVVFFTKLLMGYAFAGKAGVTFLGPTYTSMADSTASNSQRYLELVALSAESLKGHVLAVCLLFGLPIAVALTTVVNSMASKSETKADQKISFYALAVLFSLILVTVFFTASIAGHGYETIVRLHMRYYNFALPLLLIITASQLSLVPTTSKLRWRLIAAFPIGMSILYAAYTRMAPYTPNYVDSPELRGFTSNPSIFYILSGLSFLALAVWFFAEKASAKLFIYLFIPLVVVFSSFYVNRDIQGFRVPNVFDKAGMFTKQYLSDEDLSRVLIVGSEPVGLFRSLFYLDNPNSEMQILPKGDGYDLSKLPASKEWVLIIGDHPLIGKPFFQLPLNGFTLARAGGTDTIDFRRASWLGIISKTRGLSGAEPWGTWSTGAVVTLEFSAPLPEKFTVHLVANAFGPNIGKEFVAHAGDQAVKFKLAGSPEERVLEFNNPEKSRTIKIDIPGPASPKELGLSADPRSLGIGLVELRIVPQ
jgi:phosphoglycerol transferase